MVALPVTEPVIELATNIKCSDGEASLLSQLAR